MYDKFKTKKAIFLQSIIRYFPSDIIASATTTMIVCIKDHYTDNADQLRLTKELGLTLLKTPPKKNQPKLDYLNFGWECMKSSQDEHLFLECAIVLVDFSIKNLNANSVNVFIKEIFKKLQEFALSTTSGDGLYMKLEYLLVKVMMTAKDFSELIGFENLLALLNYFPTSVKNKLCEMMLNFFVQNNKKLQDGFMIHSIFQVAKSLHDKIDALSSDAEIERISKIVSELVKKIDFGRDLDKTLNVLTTARGLFINLDLVTETLIYQVILLANKAHKITNGKHNQKTQTFVKACIAYSHITIPTLGSTDTQVKLFLLTAQASLLNGLIGEADSLLKAILSTMDEAFTAEAARITSLGQKIEVAYADGLEHQGELLQSILGFLVVVPSNPENSYFQIVDGILNFLKKEQWGTSPASYAIQCRVLGSCIRYLASQSQDTLPYRIAHVESNDQVFIGSEDFTKECDQQIDYCFEQLLEIIQKLDGIKAQYYLVLFEACLDAANLLIGNCVINQKINGFVNKMFKMADKYLVENNAAPGQTK